MDEEGNKTAVLIPIEAWNILKEQLEMQSDEINIPDWHSDLVQESLEEYKKNPSAAVDFREVMKDIEKSL